MNPAQVVVRLIRLFGRIGVTLPVSLGEVSRVCCSLANSAMGPLRVVVLDVFLE